MQATFSYNRALRTPEASSREVTSVVKERLSRAVRPARIIFRKEVGIAVDDAVGPRQADLQAELRDLRRVLEDDMDATNEATAVFGRLLSRLSDRLDEIEARLDELAGSSDEVGAGPTAPARPRKTTAKPRTPARKRSPTKANEDASE
jgi:hypothetical protein